MNREARPRKEEDTFTSRALAKGFALADALAKASTPLPLGYLADLVGLTKPSALRLLQTLVEIGVAQKDGAGNYSSTQPVSLPAGPVSARDLIAAAEPEMARLNAELAETVSLAALFDDHIRVIHTLESTRQIKMSNYLNRILPPNASSLGKAIAAHQPPEIVQRLLQVFGIYQFTEKTITEPVVLKEEFERIRELGYSMEYEETVSGGCCIGAPIQVPGHPVTAAISVSLPTARYTERLETALPEMVREAARRIAAGIENPDHGDGSARKGDG